MGDVGLIEIPAFRGRSGPHNGPVPPGALRPARLGGTCIPWWPFRVRRVKVSAAGNQASSERRPINLHRMQHFQGFAG
jgi:hypothetical protein